MRSVADWHKALALGFGLAASCGGASGAGTQVEDAGKPAAGDATAPETRPSADEAPGAASALLSLDQARAYVLSLINRDRQAAGLGPVPLDAVATRAGDRHAADMASSGFTAHFGTDGSVPEQRYTEAGGVHMVTENAGCLADASSRELDHHPRFSRQSLERVQHAFMDEVPPYDGHRRNILSKRHTSVGIGLAKPKGVDVACMAQEFVDEYAQHVSLPRRARVGEAITIRGTAKDGAVVAGVGLSRIDLPSPREPKALLNLLTYQIPRTYVTFFPKGYKTTIPLEVKKNSYSIRVPLSDRKKPGLYGVSVWAMFPPSEELEMISLRTIRVE